MWFSLGTPVSSTNKTDRHEITEILLKVALSTRPLAQQVQVAVNYLKEWLIQFITFFLYIVRNEGSFQIVLTNNCSDDYFLFNYLSSLNTKKDNI